MDKKDLKKLLIEECMKRHKQTAENYLTAMHEAKQSANDYGAPEDWFDTYKSELLNKCDMLKVQLQKVLDDIKILERINFESSNSDVSFGSIVLTPEQKLFVSIGLGKIDIDGETFFAISPSVPIFQAMRNKRKGEMYEFRGKKSKIIDVF